MHVQPYLFFEGRCEEALDFYRRTLGAEVRMMMRFKDSPEPHPEGAIPPGAEDNVMHAEFLVGDSVLFGSDGCGTGTSSFHGFGLTLNVKDEAEADRVYAALGDGGKVVMPLGKTFFSPRFGMVADRFGVTWMVIVPA
ncbi:VOC family protein [Azospirillum sp.]|uniref:VOC family protein n=1 Tax=Azospirillum sp. TaxID=34012 RepID=UPI003D71FD83